MTKLIRFIHNKKVMEEIPWSKYDEEFFTKYSVNLLLKNIQMVIIDEEIPPNSFIGHVEFLGKIKTDLNDGKVRWAKVIVDVCPDGRFDIGYNLWLKVPLSRTSTWLCNGVPGKYMFESPVISKGQFIHNVKSVKPYITPTTVNIES